MGRFSNWPPKVEYTEAVHVHPVENGVVQPAVNSKKTKKAKKTSKERVRGSRR